jgi:nitrogen fixation-related uncharacterized protein
MEVLDLLVPVGIFVVGIIVSTVCGGLAVDRIVESR